jgi:hypothetical protein
MAIATVIVLADRPQHAHRWLRVRVTLTGNDASTEVHYHLVPCPFGADATARAESFAGQVLLDRARHEVAEVIDRMRDGGNPLRDEQGNSIPPVWNTYAETAGKALRYFLSRRDPRDAIPAVKLADRLTDAQIKGLLGVDQAKCDRIRTLVNQWRDVATMVEQYAPEIEE